ncbi:MAG: organic hydroperoxide resistance protein [Hymenobacteraceae bacterium]|nr:organic hydroperoxide resistance protein [Hymenobacteraceae bacterium]MDX5396755.1 organic hydroperoxide resistance protein [Hymenobacteraceae bacterium]MDX5443193.1 organic hydroperoxide resistance protein [Hymenobacteraceae bacterium]MDX5512817.1 organic hydroperoxide resistance protein [Hymenobacteraceae bacterium]
MSKTIYTAEVTSTGGRNGHVTSSDGIIDLKVRVPEGMGGEGKATNPEQLFAAGYAACFQSALMVVAGKQHKRINPESTVKAHVDLLQHDNGGYGLAVKLQVELKDMDKEEAQKLVDQAHQVCPYSIGTRGNVEVQLEVV